MTTTTAQEAAAPQQEAPPPAASDLAQQLSNPVADLVSVPLQYNWDQPVGIDRDSRMTLNFQPVIPVGLSPDLNLVTRWIMPFVNQPRFADGVGPASGMGDIVTSFFVAPITEPGELIWGAGPVFSLPTTSDPLLGTGKWAAGPTVVLLKQTEGGLTLGALANHLWSIAGDDFTGGAVREDVNATFLQPFLSYTTPTAFTFTLNLEAAADWEEEDEWTVPMNLQVTKLTEFGPLPFSVGGGVGYFLAAPGDEPDWRLRIVTTLLVPRG